MPITVAHVGNDGLDYTALVIQDGETGDEIEIQRALQIDQQDVIDGMDTYCLVRGAETHYGGIEWWTLSEGSLVLRFAEDAARALDLPLQLELAVSPEAEALVAEHLPTLLA